MLSWLKKNWWLLALIVWFFVANRVEPFRSSFWLTALGAVIIGIFSGIIEAGIRKWIARRNQSRSLPL